MLSVVPFAENKIHEKLFLRLWDCCANDKKHLYEFSKKNASIKSKKWTENAAYQWAICPYSCKTQHN